MLAMFFHDVLDVLLLKERNTQLVVLSTAALGLASGLIGTFLLLRRRALVGDVLAHAMLPGIALAFLVMVALGGSGKSLPVLLLGGALTGLLGLGCVWCITSFTRVRDDAALGIVLSVFFGLGIALMGLVQATAEGSAAGLQTFIYGKTASMVTSDMQLIGVSAVVIAIACALLFKEFALLCFDEAFAAAQGWPVRGLDLLMLALVTLVTVIGLQSVGLILMVAMLIIPAAAARFWTDRLVRMALGAAAIGAASGWLGASVSALTPRLPAGAMIVLANASVFALSMVLGIERGMLVRLTHQLRSVRRVADQHLLRALYELSESEKAGGHDAPVPIERLIQRRSWSIFRLKRTIARALQRGQVTKPDASSVALTERGIAEARAAVRQHRLWELFLITHADLAPSHVDRSADAIEHVLGKELVAQLEAALDQPRKGAIPASPHALSNSRGAP
jgi:manganese/zinc/iron transport system permease protein